MSASRRRRLAPKLGTDHHLYNKSRGDEKLRYAQKKHKNETKEALSSTIPVAGPMRSASGSDSGVILWASLTGEIQA